MTKQQNKAKAKKRQTPEERKKAESVKLILKEMGTNPDHVVDIKRSLTRIMSSPNLMNLEAQKPSVEQKDHLEEQVKKYKEYQLKHEQLQSSGELWDYEKAVK